MNQICLNKLHKTEVEILDEIDRICKKHNISYYIMYGTLIGAVRHKGFIPWDDDIDVAMPREDFDRFSLICQKELRNDYFFQTTYTDKHAYNPFGKVRKNNTVFIESNNVSQKMNVGIYVDIFVLESSNGNEWKTKLKWIITEKIRIHLQARENHRQLSLKHIWFAWIPRNIVLKLRDKLLKGKGDYYIDYFGAPPIFRRLYLKNLFEPSIELVFEGKKYHAPCGYDALLKQIYGDYMQLPPVEQRVTHNPVRISFDIKGPDEVLD